MSFKLVALIDDSLSLGSILMTKGVTVVSIETTVKKIESGIERNYDFFPKLEKTVKKSSKIFKHPSGKTGKEIVYEYLKNQSVCSWSELRKYIVNEGFASSSVNNAITRLLKEKMIVRIDYAKYITSEKIDQVREKDHLKLK